MNCFRATWKELVFSLGRKICTKTVVRFSKSTPTNKNSFMSYLSDEEKQIVSGLNRGLDLCSTLFWKRMLFFNIVTYIR